jgi:pyridoxine kinase
MYAVLEATHDGGFAEMRLVAEQESIAHPDEVFEVRALA